MIISRKFLSLDEEDNNRKFICEQYRRKELLQRDAATKLWISERQFRRVYNNYIKQWDTWLIHWLKWRKSNYKWNKDKEDKIKEFISQVKYQDFWPTFLMEELRDIGIDISDEWLRKYMIKIWKRESKRQRDMTIRHRRERKHYTWEMLQYDGSYHRWFEDRIDEEFCLLVAVDDATSEIMHMVIWENEWYDATIRFWIWYIIVHWLPESIYVDRFATYKVNHKKAIYDKSMITNFERAMTRLWCIVIKANSPQAKGRVERINQTLQDRLIKKMRLEGISNVEEANEYIKNIYIPRHNRKFKVEARKSWDKHKKLGEDIINNLLWICAIDYSRIIQNDYIVTYKTRYLQLEPKNITRVYTRTKCIVRENINGEIQVIVNDKIIPHKEIDAWRIKQKKAEYRFKVNTKKELEKKEREKTRAEEKYKLSKEKQIYYRNLSRKD